MLVSTAAISYPRSAQPLPISSTGSHVCSQATVSSAPSAVLEMAFAGRPAGDSRRGRASSIRAASAVRKNAPTLYRLRTLSSSTATGSAEMRSYNAPTLVGLKWNAIHDVKLILSMAMLSIVIPIHNEEHSILPLYDRLTAVLEPLQRPYEILFVDDASSDRSFELLANLVETDGHLKVIRLRRNFGQTAALSAGFHEAKGDIVVAMDGDLQHAPEDIPALLAKIDEGYDIASGWRQHRVDNALSRKLPSRIANWLMAKASGIDLRDFGTTFKAYRAEVLKDVNLYGELHRFIPALASFYGARIAEVPIRSTRRASGGSHYGIGRTFRVMFDILTIKFMLKYFTRPMHFFGSLGWPAPLWAAASWATSPSRSCWAMRSWPRTARSWWPGPFASRRPDDVHHRVDWRDDDADVLRKPGSPHLCRAPNPDAQAARRARHALKRGAVSAGRVPTFRTLAPRREENVPRSGDTAA
jgi:glycosyltransferase involved in cell wall biosynthesis